MSEAEPHQPTPEERMNTMMKDHDLYVELISTRNNGHSAPSEEEIEGISRTGIAACREWESQLKFLLPPLKSLLIEVVQWEPAGRNALIRPANKHMKFRSFDIPSLTDNISNLATE